MEDAHDTVRSVQRWVEDVDWDLIEDSASFAGVALRFLRENPWTLVVSGAAMSTVGALMLWNDRRHAKQGHARAFWAGVTAAASPEEAADQPTGYPAYHPDYTPAP